MIDRSDGNTTNRPPSERPSAVQAWLRTAIRVATAAVVIIGLGACEILDAFVSTPIDITVRNYCTGGNSTVNVYINDSYRGQVYSSRTFTGISKGTVRLRAVGTGYGGSTITGTYSLYVDSIWTLCPSGGGGGGTLSLDADTVGEELQPLGEDGGEGAAD